MRRFPWPLIPDRSSPCRLLVACLLAALAAPGCGHQQEARSSSVSKPPTVRLIQPQIRSIVRVVGQPSFIESYERTSIYPEADRLYREVVRGHRRQGEEGPGARHALRARVGRGFPDEEGGRQARRETGRTGPTSWWMWPTPTSRRPGHASKRPGRSSPNTRPRSIAGIRRSTGSQREVKRGVVDPQILLESTKQLKSAIAARDAARATIAKVDAEVLSKEAVLAKAKVDVEVAKSDLEVSISDAKRLEAWVGYITLSAPYDGVIVARNANTGDFVVPAAGDLTAMERAPYLAPAGHAAPIYVVDRTDVVRIFVDIPEQDANYVHVGTKATVLAQAYSEDPIPGTVTRTSWALNVKSRTLRAEIDLPNPGSQLLPGMYAYAKVVIERPGVRALPVSALTYSGEKTFCWTYHDGHAARTEIRTGVSDGQWIEVTKFKRRAESNVDDSWASVTGSEQVILGDLSILTDGTPVMVAPASSGPKVASETPTQGTAQIPVRICSKEFRHPQPRRSEQSARAFALGASRWSETEPIETTVVRA